MGQIVKVGRHPNADALYVEEINVGEEKPRQVRRAQQKANKSTRLVGMRGQTAAPPCWWLSCLHCTCLPSAGRQGGSMQWHAACCTA